MLELVKTIQSDVNSMRETLKTHIETEPKEWASVLAELMQKSFPEGDPEGHRRFHEASIKKAEDSAVFWGKMRYEITRYGVFGFLGWASYQLWLAFLHGPHK